MKLDASRNSSLHRFLLGSSPADGRSSSLANSKVYETIKRLRNEAQNPPSEGLSGDEDDRPRVLDVLSIFPKHFDK